MIDAMLIEIFLMVFYDDSRHFELNDTVETVYQFIIEPSFPYVLSDFNLNGLDETNDLYMNLLVVPENSMLSSKEEHII